LNLLITDLKKNHYSNLSRVVIFLCLIWINTLQAQSPLSKIIDFEVENTPIADALIDLSEAADINIAFHPKLFSKDQLISETFQQKRVDFILKKCLETTRIDYKVEGTHLILFKKPPRLFTISGYIQDKKTGERLVAATIWEGNSGKGTTTNDYGFFSLKIPEGPAVLQTSYLGYQPEIQKIKLTKNQKLEIGLTSSITLTEVIVTADNLEETAAHFSLGKGESVNLQGLSASVALGGEPDLMRYIQTQAGISTGADGIGGMSVRGGNVDQNLVLLDGVPIYNPSHSLGLFSVFNTHIVKSASMLTDGFSAKYGGRLSSVLDVRVKEGSTKKWQAEGEIGTLATKLIVEGPIVQDKTGLIVALRRTHIDPILKQISRKKKFENFDDGEISYYFFDVNAKLHHRFSAQDQVFLSFYKGKDDYRDGESYEYEDPDFGDYFFEEQIQELEWGNEIVSFRWNHLFGDQLFSNTTLTYSKYNYNSFNTYDDYIEIDGEVDALYSFSSFKSTIKDVGLKVDFEYYPTPQQQVLFGGGFLFRTFESGELANIFDAIDSQAEIEEAEESFDEEYIPPFFKTQEVNFYVEDKLSVTDQFSMLGGIHFAAFFTNDKTYFIPQPRLSFQWKTGHWRTNLSAGKMSQFLHILSTTGGGLPNDLWVPSTKNVRPEEAWQVAWNTQYTSEKGWSANFDVYYKKLDHLINYIELPNPPTLAEFDPTYWEEEITFGVGKSYGFSTSLAKTAGKLTGHINYAYTISERQFEDYNDGLAYPFQYTHQHEVKLGLKHQITSKIALFANWQYGSGLPYILIKTDARFAPLSNNLAAGEVERIGTINGQLLPAYHRLDAGVYFNWAGPSVKQSLSLGAYNVYNRKNPYYQYLIEGSFFEEENGFKQQNALPLLPSLAYRVVF